MSEAELWQSSVRLRLVPSYSNDEQIVILAKKHNRDSHHFRIAAAAHLRGVQAKMVAVPNYATGAAMASVITFTTAALPLATALTIATSNWLATVTSSPWPPRAVATRS